MLNLLTSHEKGNTSPRKKLRWVMQAGEKTERMLVTPELASIMLEHNDNNRHLSPSTVKRYAEQMRKGAWIYTRQPIIFSEHRLIDGQHRLQACIESGCSFEVDVAFGAKDEAFAFIDIGKKRQAGDIFSIHGVTNSTLMAAATPWVIAYEKKVPMRRNTVQRTPAELYEEYLRHPGLQESAWVAHAIARSKLAPPALMAALHYLCAKKNAGLAEQFFRSVAEGIGFTGKKDPAYRLYKKLLDNAMSHDGSLGTATIAAITIKAWNARRRGRDVGLLRYTADEAPPRII